MSDKPVFMSGDQTFIITLVSIVSVLIVVVSIVLACARATTLTNQRNQKIGVACVQNGGRWINQQCSQ